MVRTNVRVCGIGGMSHFLISSLAPCYGNVNLGTHLWTSAAQNTGLPLPLDHSRAGNHA